MSKDQHGCRYMQRKLDDGDPAQISAIFAETCPHIVELMTGPFAKTTPWYIQSHPSLDTAPFPPLHNLTTPPRLPADSKPKRLGHHLW